MIKKTMKILLAAIIFAVSFLNPSLLSEVEADNTLINPMNIMEELTKEEYMGRQSGTKGYEKAIEVMEDQLNALGVVPLLESDSYRQEYSTKIANLKSEKFSINGKTYEIMKDYMPFSRSTSGKFSNNRLIYAGIGKAEDYLHIDAKDSIVVFRWSDSNGKFGGGITDRILIAKNKGAKGVIVVANGELKIGHYEHPLNGDDIGLPVVYVSEEVASNILGISNNDTPKELQKKEVTIHLEIDRQDAVGINLLGVIPGKREDKAILLSTNLDGFGTLPDGRVYENAKYGVVSPAMLLSLAQYYKENQPDYTVIIAIVGSKWTGNDGIKAAAQSLDFTNIISSIDLYAMGGTGNPYIAYTNQEYNTFANKVSNNIKFNNDLGNSLSSILSQYTKNNFIIRDQDTWIDDAFTDTYTNVDKNRYVKGEEFLLNLINSIIKEDQTLENIENRFQYDITKVNTEYFQEIDKELNYLETKYFNVYFDESFQQKLTQNYLQAIDKVFERINRYNYYPKLDGKVKLLYLNNMSDSAKIAHRADLIEDPTRAGGGFSSNQTKYRTIAGVEPHLGNVAHELNHLLSDTKLGKMDYWTNGESTGQSYIVYFDNDGNDFNNVADLINNKLQNHEAPDVIDNARKYKTNFKWEWYTEQVRDPYGHQNTYHLLGSMYTYLRFNYGENTARRAMYRVYDNYKNIKEALVEDIDTNLENFMESWSIWMTSSGTEVGQIAKQSIENYQDQLTQYDYYKIYTLNKKDELVELETGEDNKYNENQINPQSFFDIPVIKSTQLEFASFKNDGNIYASIPYRIYFSNSKYQVHDIKAAIDEKNVYIKIKYYSPKQTYFVAFLQGDAPGLKQIYSSGTKIGENVAIIKLAKSSLKAYTAGLAFNVGEGNFISIDKEVTDKITDIPFTKVKVNGKFLTFAVQPTVINGTTLVPLRGIFEELGLTVDWNPKTNSVIGTKDGLEIRLTIGNKQAYKSGVPILLNTPGTVINGSTLVPVRFIAESLGAKVDWDGRTRTVIIETNE